MTSPTVVWFRDDLRTIDNPALLAATQRQTPVLCAYVHDTQSPGIRPLGAASRWWLHHSLVALDHSLRAYGLSLTLLEGPAEPTIARLLSETGAAAVHWNRRYGIAERTVDGIIKSHARSSGCEAVSHHAQLLHEPWTLLTGSGDPYRVFSPFARAAQTRPAPRAPLPAPAPAAAYSYPSLDIEELALLPPVDWTAGIRERWSPGESSALNRARDFAARQASDYRDDRDRPARAGTSFLSPHLRFGEISPFQAWHLSDSADFRRELLWRDFAHYVSYFWPNMASENLRPQFDHFEWDPHPELSFHAWTEGRTGVPLVDAGMRELWHTGYMHNRVRMVAASYLVKNLLVDWRKGEQWFWDTLVDADPASNPFNWQWVAGAGVDATPYFRVFNPELQADKWDPDGSYRRRWLPDWDTVDYPPPLVDTAESRRRALAHYKSMSRSTDSRIRDPQLALPDWRTAG